MPLNENSIVVQTKEEMGLVEHVRLNKRQYYNADRTRVVDEGDEDAAFFYGGPGQLVSRSEAESLGASYTDASGEDEHLDTLHVEVEAAHGLPGAGRVEGAGKATIPVTQADRAVAGGIPREEVSGKEARRTEGEAFLDGDLKPLPDQKVVGQTARTKQKGQMEPAHYTEEEKEKVGTPAAKQQARAGAGQSTQETEEKSRQPGGDKMAQKPTDK